MAQRLEEEVSSEMGGQGAETTQPGGTVPVCGWGGRRLDLGGPGGGAFV